MMSIFSNQRAIGELTEKEVLALAIANEEEDSRIYQLFADQCLELFPATAKIFADMAEEEREHRASLFAVYRTRFGEHLPPYSAGGCARFSGASPRLVDEKPRAGTNAGGGKLNGNAGCKFL